MSQTVVRCGRLVDVLAGDVRADHDVVIEGERIGAVRPSGEVPAGTTLIDLSDATVAPGLIDLHTHLVGGIEDGSYAEILTRSEADEALIGVQHARETLRAGITTVRDVGSFRAFTDVALRRGIEAGWFEGPRMHVAGGYVTCTGGGGEVTGFAADVSVPDTMRVGVADSVDEVRRAVRRLLAGGADFIKVIATGAVLAPGTTPGAPEFSEAELRAAVEETALYGTYVAAHAHGAEGIKRAVRAGVRSIEHGSIADDEALALMAEHGTYFVADVYNGDWIDEIGRANGWPAATLQKNTDTTQTQRSAFTKAIGMGVRIAFGTDAGVFPHGKNARQLPIMVRLGMTPVQALQAATTVAAQCLGRDDLGALEAGRLADLVAVRGHDLADLSPFVDDVVCVIKGGRSVTLSNS
jgi:imidazolonepropionase-like amidohydrolase